MDGDPKPGVDAVKKFTKIYPLSQASAPPELKFVDMSGKPFNMVGPADDRFWDMLNKVVQEESTDAVDPTTLGIWASIGIQKGRPFQPDARMKKILTEAAAVGDATGRALAYRVRERSAYFFDDRQWKMPFIGGYKFEWQPGVPNLDAAAMYFFAATGVTPAMDTKIVGEGSTYPWTAVDSQGNALDGSRNYRLHLPPKIPVRTFWSVIVYDTQTRSMLQTDHSSPASAARTRRRWSTMTAPWTSISAPRPRPARRTTGFRPFPGRAGSRSCVCMVLWSRGSTRPGNRTTSSSWNRFVVIHGSLTEARSLPQVSRKVTWGFQIS